MVLLRLVYLHDLTQREIVRMLGWSESKVSRFLARAMKEIETHTLKELKKRDPWLELSWQDFVGRRSPFVVLLSADAPDCAQSRITD